MKEQIESLMSKYLENKTTYQETQILIEHLNKSERDRQILNLAAAGLRQMQLRNRH